MQDPKPVEAPSGGYSVVDAIVDGRLSLEDVIEQYRPATAGERAKGAAVNYYRGFAQTILSGNSSLFALEGKGLEAIGMKDLAKRFRAASYDTSQGRVGSWDVAGAMGQAAPQMQNDPWYWKMLTSEGPQAAGSMLGMTLVPGPKGSKLKGLASMPTGGLAIATRGALTQASQGFHEALAAKADETTAWTAFAINALGGATEGLPGLAPRRIGEILNRVDRASGGGLKRAMLVGAKTGFGEAFQEAFQQTLSNAGAKVLYEEDRELLRGVVESGRGAFLVGLLAGGASGMAQPQQGAQGPTVRSGAPEAQPGMEGAQTPQTRAKPLRVDLGSLDTETASAVKDFAADLGEVVHPVEDADPALVEFGKRRGVRVQFVESEDGTPLRRPAGYMRDGAVAIVDVNAPDALASLVDHEIGHHVLETVPGARERIVELLGPELRAAALAEYQQDIVASEIRKAGRDLTPEEIQAIEAQAAQIPDDEGITRLAEDFSPVIRLMRTNPEAFSKVEDVGFWRGIVRAVLDVGRSLLRRPSAAEQELAKRYRSLARRGQAARMDPKEGVEIARILTSFLDESVGQTRASTPQSQGAPSPIPESGMGEEAQAQNIGQGPQFAAPRQTDTPEFKSWFGDSKVVDENGKPLVVYHGTDADFSQFDPDKLGAKGAKPAQIGFWFSDDKDYSEAHGNRVVDAYLSMSNPYIVKDSDALQSLASNEAKIKSLKDQGYDGVAIKPKNEKLGRFDVRTPGIYAVFSPTQIKSATGNRGTFDPNNPDIRFAAPRTQSNLPKQDDSRSARVRAYMQNALEPLRRVSQAAIEAGKTKRDPFLAESLRTSRSRTRIQDEKAALVDPLLKTIADSGVSMDDAEAFLLARAAPARNALVQARTGKPNGSGMTDAAAQAVTTAALSGPNAAGYQAIARDFDALTKRTRDLWESYGLESPEMIRSMEQQQPAYAPFRSEPDVEGKPRGAGRQIKGREFKAALGRSSMAENPITYAVEDLNRAIIRGETNQARQELYDFVKDVGDSGFAYVDVPPMKETLVNGSVRKVPDFQEAENEITLKVKGDLRRVRFTDPYAPIARALRGLDREQVPEVVQKVLRPLTKWPVAFSTRWNPFFPPVNFARDISGAALNEQSLKIVAPAALSRSAKEVFTKGPLYQRFRRAGGPVAFLDLQRTVEEVAADIRADVEKQTTGNDPRSWPRKTWAKYQEFVERNNDYAEAIVRLSGFRYAIEELGYSDAKAALFAKDLTTNFENRGQAAWINTLYAFSNANIQSLDKFTRVMKKPGARKLAFALAGAAYAMSAINRTVGGEDDDGIPYYDKIDPFTRRSSAILMNPSGDGTYIKIPLPFMWGWFHVLGDQMATAAYTGDTEKAFDAMVDATDQHFNFLGASPSFNQLVAPTALDPFVQASENKTFSGAPVYPSTFGDKTKPDSELAWDNTNKPLVEIVRWINKATGGTSTKSGAIDVSAITIENAFKAMFGGAGGEATRSAEVIRKIATGEDTTLNDIPLARRFMGEVSLRDSRRVFLDYSRLVDQAVKDEKAGNEYDARLYRMRLRIKGIKDRIGDLEDKVRASDSLSDRKQYQERIRALMVQGVELIRETQK